MITLAKKLIYTFTTINVILTQSHVESMIPSISIFDFRVNGIPAFFQIYLRIPPSFQIQRLE